MFATKKSVTVKYSCERTADITNTFSCKLRIGLGMLSDFLVSFMYYSNNYVYCKDLKNRGNYGIFVLRRYLIYQYCPNVYKKNYITLFHAVRCKSFRLIVRITEEIYKRVTERIQKKLKRKDLKEMSKLSFVWNLQQ